MILNYQGGYSGINVMGGGGVRCLFLGLKFSTPVFFGSKKSVQIFLGSNFCQANGCDI